MSWVKTTNLVRTAKPRLLTPEEVESVIAIIPNVKSPIKEASLVATNNIKQYFRKQLAFIELCPDALDDFKKGIVNEFNRSIIDPGSAIGITAAEAIGRTITQTALNTFHSSGISANVSSGIDAMKEMINASKDRKVDSSVIILKDKGISFIETFRKRRTLVGLSLNMIIKDFIIDTPENLKTDSDWWLKPYLKMSKTTLPGKPLLPETQKILRLFLDTNQMYQYRITPEMIKRNLENEHPIGVTVVHSPIKEGILDIYPNGPEISSKLKEKLPKKKTFIDKQGIFLEIVMLDVLGIRKDHYKPRIFKGIPGITAIFPIKTEVHRIVKETIKPYTAEDIKLSEGDLATPTSSVFVLDSLLMTSLNIKAEKLIYLLNLIGFKVLRYDNSTMLCKHPIASFKQKEKGTYDIVLTDPNVDLSFPFQVLGYKKSSETIEIPTGADLNVWKNPIKLLQSVYSKFLSAFEERKTELYKKRIFVAPLDDPFITAYHDYHIRANGINLQEILSREEIDETRSHCNNIHLLCEYLGVHAAKNYYIKNLTEIVEAPGMYVESRHISIIASFVFNLGRPYGATHPGISRQPIKHLSLASFQKSVDNITRHAVFGKKEDILDVSTSISVGRAIFSGTGYLDVIGVDLSFDEMSDVKSSGKTLIESEIVKKANKYMIIDNNSLYGTRMTLADVPKGIPVVKKLLVNPFADLTDMLNTTLKNYGYVINPLMNGVMTVNVEQKVREVKRKEREIVKLIVVPMKVKNVEKPVVLKVVQDDD